MGLEYAVLYQLDDDGTAKPISPDNPIYVSSGGASPAGTDITKVGGNAVTTSLPVGVVGTVTVGTHAVTQSGTWSVTATPSVSATATGLTAFRNAALTNTATTVKAAAGRVHYFDFYNPNAAVVFVNFYNALIANVTVGTTTPVWTIAVPPGVSRSDYLNSSISFATGISVSVTAAVTGNTAPTTPILANVAYI